MPRDTITKNSAGGRQEQKQQPPRQALKLVRDAAVIIINSISSYAPRFLQSRKAGEQQKEKLKREKGVPSSDSEDDCFVPQECQKCHEILKRPTPCACNICLTLNYPEQKEEEARRGEKK